MNLYLRLLILLFRLIGLPRKGPLEESRVAFRVLPNDCHVNLHMNNGRYLSFMEVSSSAVAGEVGYTGSPPPMPEELRIWAELGTAKKEKSDERK